MDPKWRGGDYYDAAVGDGPWQGLAVARMVAQVTFRSDNVFTDRFGRDLADADAENSGIGLWDKFEVERYLDHHGDRLVRRFDTNSYLLIGKAMDLHDVARGRGGLAQAMRRVTARTLAIGISSDVLYPTYQQRQIRDLIAVNGVAAEYVEVDSPHGHDAFLIDTAQVGEPLQRFLQQA
jgi:homoserine O-acetyltransferase